MEAAMEMVARVTSTSNSVKINEHQCKRLAKVYEEIGRRLSSKTIKKSLNVKPLLKVMETGELLISQCAGPDWFRTVLVNAENKEAFEELHANLHLWFRTIFSVELRTPEVDYVTDAIDDIKAMLETLENIQKKGEQEQSFLTVALYQVKKRAQLLEGLKREELGIVFCSQELPALRLKPQSEVDVVEPLSLGPQPAIEVWEPQSPGPQRAIEVWEPLYPEPPQALLSLEPQPAPQSPKPQPAPLSLKLESASLSPEPQAAPLSPKPKPAPLPLKPKSAPLSLEPQPAPLPLKPKSALLSLEPQAASLSPGPQAAPLSPKPKPAPLPPQPKSAPLSPKPKPAPLPPKPKSAPLSLEPQPASLSPEPQPAPLPPKPKSAPLSLEPQPASLSPKPQAAPLSPKPKPSPLPLKLKSAPLSLEPQPASLSPEPQAAPLSLEPQPPPLPPEPKLAPLSLEPQPASLSPEPQPAPLSLEPQLVVEVWEPLYLGPQPVPQSLKWEVWEPLSLGPQPVPMSLKCQEFIEVWERPSSGSQPLVVVADSMCGSEFIPPDLAIPMSEIKVREEVLIGEGASAKVKKAEWLGLPCAVKIFKDQDVEKFVRKEVELHQKLRSVYIVKLNGVAVEGNNCMILMELMDFNLHDLILEKQKQLQSKPSKGVLKEQSPFRLQDAVGLMLQIAKGMHYLHHVHNILHGDLKTENVLGQRIGRDNYRLKVADFGISEQLCPDMPRAFGTRGTGFFRAPEVMLGMVEYSLKADVYSFAMVSYEILTGRRPFEVEGNTAKLRTEVKRGRRPPLPVDLPIVVRDLVERCWDGDQDMRPLFSKIREELERMERMEMETETETETETKTETKTETETETEKETETETKTETKTETETETVCVPRRRWKRAWGGFWCR